MLAFTAHIIIGTNRVLYHNSGYTYYKKLATIDVTTITVLEPSQRTLISPASKALKKLRC